MKCVSFNVNSVRLRLHQLEAVINTHSPEFIGLQETKVTDQDFPLEALEAFGYHVAYIGQKTHYGVALMSRRPFTKVIKGFETDDDTAQKRFIGGEFILDDGSPITVLNGYFPQGESQDHPVKFPNKQKFYADLMDHLKTNHTPDNKLIIMGDMNISPEDNDIGIGEDNRKRWLKTGKCSFLPIEREWLQTLYSWGLKDTFRIHHPEEYNVFSWFDYRSKGFEREPRRGLRIDLILATAGLANASVSAGVDYEVRAMDKPSDHCPIWTEFEL